MGSPWTGPRPCLGRALAALTRAWPVASICFADADRAAKRRKEEAGKGQLRAAYPYYLANKPYQPNTDLEVINKYTGEVRRRRRRARRGVCSTTAAVEHVGRSRRVWRAPTRVLSARPSPPPRPRSQRWQRSQRTSARPSSCTYVVCSAEEDADGPGPMRGTFPTLRHVRAPGPHSWSSSLRSGTKSCHRPCASRPASRSSACRALAVRRAGPPDRACGARFGTQGRPRRDYARH